MIDILIKLCFFYIWMNMNRKKKWSESISALVSLCRLYHHRHNYFSLDDQPCEKLNDHIEHLEIFFCHIVPWVVNNKIFFLCYLKNISFNCLMFFYSLTSFYLYMVVHFHYPFTHVSTYNSFSTFFCLSFQSKLSTLRIFSHATESNVSCSA